jgi:hypothetical protein
MSLIRTVQRFQNASLTYFKGLMHAGDARLGVEHEHWVPAAVSLYYAVFNLTVAALLASDCNPTVRHEGTDMSLNEALDRGADPYHFIRHIDALSFAREEMQREFVQAVERLQELRLYASYGPRMYVLSGARLRVDTCAIDAAEFIRRVRQEADQLETYFQLFRSYLQEQTRTNPNQQAYALTEASIEQHPEDSIRELGRYRTERAVTLAREIHTAVFPYKPRS